jgi:hypothetical protein
VIGVLLALMACPVAQGLARAREALAGGDYHAAWEALAKEEEDELARWRGRTEILDSAGDPTGALAAARAGLAIDPAQKDLLFRAARAAIWVEDREGATAYSARLLEAARTVGEPGSEERLEWVRAATELATRTEALVARESALERAVARLRSVALGGAALWLFLVACVLRRQGRSSRPVS